MPLWSWGRHGSKAASTTLRTTEQGGVPVGKFHRLPMRRFRYSRFVQAATECGQLGDEFRSRRMANQATRFWFSAYAMTVARAFKLDLRLQSHRENREKHEPKRRPQQWQQAPRKVRRCPAYSGERASIEWPCMTHRPLKRLHHKLKRLPEPKRAGNTRPLACQRIRSRLIGAQVLML